jgi:DNA-directed RNA polymerase specialized sigma24 family protein
MRVSTGLDIRRLFAAPCLYSLADSHVEDTTTLVDAIATLPIRQRSVIVMRYYLDLSEREIAVAVGCRPGTR